MDLSYDMLYEILVKNVKAGDYELLLNIYEEEIEKYNLIIQRISRRPKEQEFSSNVISCFQ